MVKLSEEIRKSIGDRYADALEFILEVRVNRRKQYGDSYTEDSELFLLFQLENKVKRLALQFGPPVGGDIRCARVSRDFGRHKTAIDSIDDIVHYAVFLRQKLTSDEDK